MLFFGEGTRYFRNDAYGGEHMAMSEATRDNKRAGARILGVIFQVLALITFLGTALATVAVVKLGLFFGITGSNNVPAWITFGIGLFVSCVLAGLGYTLGILCAIYDRQEPPSSAGGNHKQGTPIRIPNQPSPYRPSHTIVHSEEAPAPPRPAVKSVSPSPQEDPKSPESDDSQKSPLWEWLTRERHFGQT